MIGFLKILAIIAITVAPFMLVSIIPGFSLDISFLKNPLNILFPAFSVPNLITSLFGKSWLVISVILGLLAQLLIAMAVWGFGRWVKSWFSKGGPKGRQ